MKVEDVLSRYDENKAALAGSLREFLFGQLKGIIEFPDPSASLIGYGFGPGYKDTICTILFSKKGLKLGFYRGSELPDPAKLLTGTGKLHRYVEIKSAADLRNPGIRKLISEALSAYAVRKN